MGLEAPFWISQPPKRFNQISSQEGQENPSQIFRIFLQLLLTDHVKNWSLVFFSPSSIESKCNDLSSSDSEASRSNLETTIHTVAMEAQSSIQTLHCEAAAAAVALWVESTTKEPSST